MSKSRIVTSGLVLSVLLLLAGCSFMMDPSGSSDPSLMVGQDVVRDVSRSSGEFAFETYVSVDVHLDVTVLGETGGADSVVIATVLDPEGNRLYRGQIAEDGSLSGMFGVATATEYVTLTLEGPGLDTRSVRISDPSDLSAVVRTMEIAPRSGAMGIAVSGLLDSDEDGVPDIYDDAPGQIEIAFGGKFPANLEDKVFTVVYEDNFPSLGDGDYNDFVVDYSLEFGADRAGVLIFVSGSATAIAKIAGYDHEFGIMLRIPGAVGELSTKLNGQERLSNVSVGEEIRIPLFPSTEEATTSMQATATFDLLFTAGSSAAKVADLPPAPFDPYLFIHDTGYDVHLIDKQPLPGSKVSPNEDYRDANGFPRALLVPPPRLGPELPPRFSPPRELTSILDAYPRFQAWVDAEGGNDPDGNATSNWYLSPNPDFVMEIP